MSVSNYATAEEAILRAMEFSPTDDQAHAAKAVAMLLCSDKPYPTLIINGFAGTGKTTLTKAICSAARQMGFKTSLLAPTGRAAKVLSNTTRLFASTIHRTIFKQYNTEGGRSFPLTQNKQNNTLFIVDEASLIPNGNSSVSQSGASWGSGFLLNDLVEYVFSAPNNRLILIGDPDQLPPIGCDAPPALDPDSLTSLGLTVGRCFLRQIVRQTEGLIIQDATLLRKTINDTDATDLPTLVGADNEQVELLSGESLTEKIESAYSQFGPQNTIIITRSNAAAAKISMGLRQQVMATEECLTRGDLLMVTRNNYLWTRNLPQVGFIANGDIAEVVSVNSFSSLYGLQFADVSVRLLEHDNIDIDCLLLLDTLTADVWLNGNRLKSTAEINEILSNGFEEDYADVSPWKRAIAMHDDPHFNALQARFAYATTCHKAQGGQWQAVFVDASCRQLTDENLQSEARWLYTAATRATERLFLVNYPKADL